MKYISTRNQNQTGEKDASECIIQGIAADKGLFVPSEIPVLRKTLSEMKGLSYQEIAFEILSLFLTDYTEAELKDCIRQAYDDKFAAKEVVPIKQAGGAYFLELYHGKTAAFKDMALSILPYFLTTAMKKHKEEKRVAILTATSGDTGKAALEGFADVPGTEVIVFYPSDGVSEVQKRQMTTQEGVNTHVFGIKGNFDDAQTGVKQIFADDTMADALAEKGYRLSSANSINIGRLVPQVAYYVYAYVKLLERGAIKEGESINITVPTGNFGNILAAYYAGRLGVPVHKLICASNKNQVLTDFINTGIYDINRSFYVTNSPSMDILISSNLERLLFHLSGGNGAEIKALMEALNTEKRYEVSDQIKAGMKAFYGGFADEKSTCDTIGKLYQAENYLMDTHTAVAYNVYEAYKKETGDETVTVIASTASPYKFADSVADAVGLPLKSNGFENIKAVNEKTGVSIPAGLRDLEKKTVRHEAVIERDGLKTAVMESLK